MNASFVLRPPRHPADDAQLAEMRSAANPDWPVTAEQIARDEAGRDPALYFSALVAEQRGRVVAAGSIGHDDFAFEEGRYWGSLSVHPDARGQGVGRALYGELLGQVRARGAREVRTMLSDLPQDAPGRAFLERRGFRQAWERYEFTLDTRQADLGRFGGLLAQVAASGVELRSIAALADDPQRDRRLYELDWQLFQDVPMGNVLTKRPFETWLRQELADPDFRPELSFAARRADVNGPLTGPYIGYSTLFRHPSGFFFIGMTGVRREDRGRGIAKALKVAAMRALAQSGGGEIRTFNDAPNRAMVSMNEALGFVRGPTRFRYELHLEGEA